MSHADDLDMPAIVLAAYGSAEDRGLQTYQRVADFYSRAFPGSWIELSFSSSAIRRRLAAGGKNVPDPFTSLSHVHAEGWRNVVVQSLHLVPGGQFHHIASLVRGLQGVKGRFGFEFLGLGLPLLSSQEDFSSVAFALAEHVRCISGISQDDASSAGLSCIGKSAAVLMGHGTNHPADSAYSHLAIHLSQVIKADVFLGTLEGYPGLSEVMGQLSACGASRVHLFPFLLVAGAHALLDMAGPAEDSWRSRFLSAGYQVDVHAVGLGEIDSFLEIFARHTREACGRSLVSTLRLQSD